MPRNRQHRTAAQAPKSKKRPRRYHHGRAQGKVNEKKIRRALPAFDRAEADAAAISASAERNRVEIAEWRELLEGLEHVSPSPLASPPAI